MRVIVGIGNPGREYQHTRHNCGFLVLAELARRHGLGTWRTDFSALTADWPDAPGGRVVLVKPQTYVNRSGEAVQAVLAYYQIPVADLLVVVDDIHLPPGQLRLRADGSPGGHNGLKDIQARIGSLYPRLRLGIGEPPPGSDQVNWVLGGFADQERPVIASMVQRAADCCEQWLGGGMQAAGRFNVPAPPLIPAPPPAS